MQLNRLFLISLMVCSPAFALDSPDAYVDGSLLRWTSIVAQAINVHKADGSFVESLSGQSTSWSPTDSGSYYLVATDAGPWTGWARSSTVTVDVDGTGVTLPYQFVVSQSDGSVNWQSPGYPHLMNVHLADGTYLTTLAEGATTWIPSSPGSYYLVASTVDDWSTWIRSNTIEVNSNTIPPVVSGPVEIRVEDGAIVWDAITIATGINIHATRIDGVDTSGSDYVTSISGESTRWQPTVGGDYFIQVVTDQHWSNWERSNVVTVQNLAVVDFEITVPAYMSNELLIRINWGSINTTASWVRDESWFISEQFPVNTENLLVVTFTDRNGELELGTYEQMLFTIPGSRYIYLIQADQFDTDRWDSDGDGISNLNELLRGSDPLIDESQSLEIRDVLGPFGREAVSSLRIYPSILEASIPDERPYFEDFSALTPVVFNGENFNDSASSTIDIDVAGNGTLAKKELTRSSPAYFTSIEQEGTRTNTGTSVQWSGTHSRFNVEHGCTFQRQLQSETSRLNDGSMTQVGFQDYTNFCDSIDNYDFTYTLTGVVVDDSSLCEATTGTITIKPRRFFQGSSWEYFKEPDDIYWTVTGLDDEGQLIEEFLAPIDITFYCNFSDL